MTKTTFDKFKDEILALAHRIMEEKAPAYTRGEADVLNNFKSVGQRLGLTPKQVYGVYFDKHIDAIIASIKSDTIYQAEPLETRIADAINYLIIYYCLTHEDL